MNKKILSMSLSLIAGSLFSCGEAPDITTPEHTHTLTFVEGTEATCVESGVLSHYHCDQCNKDFSDQNANKELKTTEIPALGHQMSGPKGGVEATCKEEGMQTYYKCAREPGVYYKNAEGTETFDNYEDIVIPRTSHTYNSVEISGNYKKEYKAFETFDIDNLVVKAKCSWCERTYELKKDEYTISYQTADSFRPGDTKVILNVTELSISKDITGLTVSKAIVERPNPSTTTFIYDGKEHILFIPESDKYVVSNNKKTEPGTYVATVSLIDKPNYCWDNGNSEDLHIEFVIAQATNSITGLANSYVTTCLKAPDLSSVKCTSGSLKIRYFKDIECTSEVTTSNLKAGDYFIRVETIDDTYSADIRVVPLKVNHLTNHFGAKEGTIYENGHTEYWKCSGCGDAFLDKDLQCKVDDVTNQNLVSVKGNIVDESAISANSISITKLNEKSAEGFSNLYQVNIDSSSEFMHGQFYSDKVITSYDELYFASKTSGYWTFEPSIYAYRQNEWVYFLLFRNDDNTFNLEVKDSNGKILYSKTNMSAFKGQDPGVYTNNALNALLFGNADICPMRDGANALNVYTTELRGYKNEKFDVVTNSRTDYNIVYQKNNRYIKAAKDLFVENIKEAGSLSSISESVSSSERYSETTKSISIGNTALLSSSGALVNENLENGYIIKTVGQSIFVYAENEIDYIIAISKVMEIMFDYQFYAANDKYIKHSSNLSFVKMNQIFNPSYQDRRNTTDATWLNSDTAGYLGYDGGYEWHVTGQTHSICDRYVNYVNNKASHPDWYSYGADKWGQKQYQLCYSAHGSSSEYQAMVDAVCNDVIADTTSTSGDNHAWIFDNSNSPTFVIDLSMQDNWYQCDCSSCQAEIQKYGSFAGQQLHFVNDVANKMDAWFKANKPNVKHFYKVLAYQQCQKAPTNIDFTINKNVLVQFAPVYVDLTKPIAPTGVNKEQYDDLKAWVDLFRGQPNVSADNIAVWYYSYSTNNIIPVFDYDAIQETYQNTRALGVKKISNEFITNGTPVTYFQDLNVYLKAKLMENDRVNLKQITEDFISNYYGVAAPKILEFFEACNANMRNTYTDSNAIFDDHNNKKYWSKDVVNNLITICNDAVNLVSNSNETEERKAFLIDRVNREKATAVYMLIQFGYTTFSNKSEYKKFFSSVCEKFGITHVDISTTVTNWLNSK